MKRNRIRNIPLLLRHRSYRRRTIVSVFAYLGALATLLEVASRTVNDPLASYLDSLWVTGGLALVGTALSRASDPAARLGELLRAGKRGASLERTG